MKTFESLQELGEFLGRDRGIDLQDCIDRAGGSGNGCLGEVYKVYDIVRDIRTSKDWHPGILCRKNDRQAYFSMGTDFMKINYLYMSEYFPIEPTRENGLIKRTGFRRSLIEISMNLLRSLPSLGQLGNDDCKVCKNSTELRQSRTR